MTTKQEEAIIRHGNNLNAIFNTELGALELCKKLRRLELKATSITTALCNGEIEQETADNELLKIKITINKLLDYRQKSIPVFINSDPRGYALKIDDDYIRAHNITIHRDCGGYGILAPEIGKDGN